MKAEFPLFLSHLDLAHRYWQRLINPGDVVVDATCGNGYDSLVLAELVLTEDGGRLFAFDIQQQAIDKTRTLLEGRLSLKQMEQVSLVLDSHADFSKFIEPGTVQLVVYNLGYLPGADKGKTTQVDSTLTSVASAMDLLVYGGAISITCYPGHEEGAKEETALLEWAARLDPQQWSCCHHRWLNRKQAPSVLLIQQRCRKDDV